MSLPSYVSLGGLVRGSVGLTEWDRDRRRRACVHVQDLRNHGTSPHNEQTTYRDYARDVSHFLKGQNLKDIVLIGHSL